MAERRALEARGDLPGLRRGELKRLDRVLTQEVPALRALASGGGAPTES